MYDIQDGIAVITLDAPPVNSLGHALRQHIAQGLQAAVEDPAVQGVVLTGNDKAFSAGADVTEFGTPLQFQEPILPTVIAQVEGFDKPVVAALSGVALGGGLELALACHGRVAAASARVGLPEITLGLIPGAGGTQRLPRLIGAGQAYDFMSSGKLQTAAQLRDSGLFDEVVDGEVVAAAVRRALALAEAGQPYPKASERQLEPAMVQAEVQAQTEKLKPRQRKQPAYAALLQALGACAGPFDEGLQRERELFLALMSTTAAQALRYQFKVEREATKLPAELRTAPRPVRRVAVIGAGTMGSGIAIAALEAGLEVVLLEQAAEALQAGQARIGAYIRGRLESGRLAPAKAEAMGKALTATLEWASLADADLVIEAVFEDIDVKREVFGKIDAHARPGAVLASNTSYLSVDEIAAATARPGDVLGLHFFSPANVMKLLEVVRGEQTAPDVLATGMAFGAALKKVPVLTGNGFGFIGNRIYNAYRRECEFMLEDGAWPEEVDAALTDFGFAMGPFAVADLSGLDIAWRMRKAQAANRDPDERYVDILDRLCEAGRLGRKTGAGYYTYADGVQARETDGDVRAIIQDASRRREILRRQLDAPEIQRRALLALVNEAAHVVADGIAARASDVDVVFVQGYGFPRWEGGPVFWARQQEREQLEADLHAMALQSGAGFKVADLSVLYED